MVFPGMHVVTNLFYDDNVSRVQQIVPVEPFFKG